MIITTTKRRKKIVQKLRPPGIGDRDRTGTRCNREETQEASIASQFDIVRFEAWDFISLHFLIDYYTSEPEIY